MDNRKTILTALQYFQAAVEAVRSGTMLLNEIVAGYDADNDIAKYRQSLFVPISGGLPFHEKNSQEEAKDPGIFNFTRQEILKMPKQIRKRIRKEKLSDHTRRKENGVYEVRYMINGISYYGSSKNPAEAKKKFIEDVIAKSKKQTETKAADDAPAVTKNPQRIEMPVGEYALHYLETFKKPNICKQSYKNYRTIIRNHIASYFDGVHIKDVTASACQKLLNNLLAIKKFRTAEDVKNLLSWICGAAAGDKILSSNPMENVKIPKHEREHGKQIPVQIMRAYLSVPPQNHYDCCMRLMSYTGVRPCELRTIRFEDGFAIVKDAKKSPNTKPTYRKIPLHPDLLPYLEDLKACISAGTARLESAFREKFPEGYRLYDLRHTFTSRIQECGANKSWVDYITAHSAAKNTTDRVYTHWSDEFQRQEMEKLHY